MRTKVKVVKNKVAPPFRETEFDILFGVGISREGDILDLAADSGIVEKSGAWYSYKSERLGQGRDNTRNMLRENPALLREIESLVREKFGIQAGAKAPDAAAKGDKPAGKTDKPPRA
jgi:recombination protein RecA